VSQEAAPVDRPRLRADARRNHDALLENAAAAFAQHGVDASLEDIARRAGVGIGTLYRHFPTRDALVEAAYRRGVEQLCDAADELMAAGPPDVALEQWMLRFVGYVATKRGLAATLKEAGDSHAELFAYVRGRIMTAITTLLDEATNAGLIRGDVDATDLLRAISGVCMVSDQAGWEEQSRRLVALLMDGLRYRAPASP
jgi:AcrR family transcriptional regulator